MLDEDRELLIRTLLELQLLLLRLRLRMSV